MKTLVCEICENFQLLSDAAFKEWMVSSDLLEKEKSQFEELIQWMRDDQREPAVTKFTSGVIRDIAREFEYQNSRNIISKEYDFDFKWTTEEVYTIAEFLQNSPEDAQQWDAYYYGYFTGKYENSDYPELYEIKKEIDQLYELNDDKTVALIHKFFMAKGAKRFLAD